MSTDLFDGDAFCDEGIQVEVALFVVIHHQRHTAREAAGVEGLLIGFRTSDGVNHHVCAVSLP
ncbi:hypothetical protein J1902_08760 [Arthrobacter sp. PO-11]|uniref:Uncharacterized protein n=1 Tax=Arthrobacter cavernae TaxID=2817681 RepID=A0A939HHP3_9MICC|nr:hypothetical protein [Arthrobacter cavernae]